MSHLDELFHWAQKINHATDEWLKAQGINYNLFAILHTLQTQPDCTQKYIAEEWLLPKQTVSTLCKQLEAQGLLRMAAGQDKREKTLALTKQGHAFAQPILDAVAVQEKAAFREFGREKTRLLMGLLKELAELIEQQNAEQ